MVSIGASFLFSVHKYNKHGFDRVINQNFAKLSREKGKPEPKKKRIYFPFTDKFKSSKSHDRIQKSSVLIITKTKNGLQ